MLNDEQARLRALDVKQSFIVQAPAGSGKTSLLVQRYLALLTIVKNEPEEIVAITFTRKAAAEMRARIISALQLGLQSKEPEDTYQAQLWRLAKKALQRDSTQTWQLLSNPQRLKIMTIDALCTYIAGKMPILSRFGAQPQQEEQVDNLYARAVEQLLHGENIPAQWQDDINCLLLHLDNDHEKIQKLLMHMLKIREQWLPAIANNTDLLELRNKLEAAMQNVRQEAIEWLINNIPECLDLSVFEMSMPESVADWIGLRAKLMTADGEWLKRLTAKQGFLPVSAATNKEERRLLEERKRSAERIIEQLSDYPVFKQKLDALRFLPNESYSEQQWRVIEGLCKVLVLLVANLTLVFRDSGLVDFSQVALAAQAVIANDNDTALRMYGSIQHVLIDEFQDTSISQYELLRQMTLHWSNGDGKTLFLVGDPMQSIYRFRQAEVGLFLQMRDYGINQVSLEFLRLTKNFRSSDAIVQWINHTCKEIFPQANDIVLGAIEYTPAESMQQIGNDQTYVESIVADIGFEANAVLEIVLKERELDVNQSIAILVRAKSHVQDVLQLLRSAGVPCNAVQLEALAQRQLVQDLLAITRCLLHLADKVAWLALLRAPWCGLTLVELETIAKFNGTVWQAIQDSLVLDKLGVESSMRVTRLVVAMQNAFNVLQTSTIEQAVQYAWYALGGNQCLTQYSQILEFEAYIGFLRELAATQRFFDAAYLEQQLEELTLPSSNNASNAVQVMTIHKAKGLEYDVVIMPGLNRSLRGSQSQLLLLERRDFQEDYLLLAPIKAAHEVSDQMYDYLAWCEQQRQRYEDSRVFYVAVTRAKRKLYCVAELSEDKPKTNTTLQLIWPYLQTRQYVPNMLSMKSQEEVTTTALSRLPFTWFEQNKLELIHKQGKKVEYEAWQDDWLQSCGILMHRVLFNIAQVGIEEYKALQLEQVSNGWRKYFIAQGMLPRHIDLAVDLVYKAITNVLSDQFGQKILSKHHKDSFAELPLTYKYNNEFENIVIDRLFIDHDDHVWLIDYKLILDNSDLDRAVTQYTPQIKRYAKAVTNLYPNKKLTAGLYFPLNSMFQKIL